MAGELKRLRGRLRKGACKRNIRRYQIKRRGNRVSQKPRNELLKAKRVANGMLRAGKRLREQRTEKNPFDLSTRRSINNRGESGFGGTRRAETRRKKTRGNRDLDKCRADCPGSLYFLFSFFPFLPSWWKLWTEWCHRGREAGLVPLDHSGLHNSRSSVHTVYNVTHLRCHGQRLKT